MYYSFTSLESVNLLEADFYIVRAADALEAARTYIPSDPRRVEDKSFRSQL